MIQEDSKKLVADCANLQKQVLEKFANAVLEEVADQIKSRDARISSLENTLGTLILWSQRELGKSAVKELLEMMDAAPPMNSHQQEN